MFKFQYFIIFLIICSCQTNRQCRSNEIKTIFFDKGKDKFIHYVLIPDFDRKCMDSIQMVTIAKRYSDTISIGRPALKIKFFNSDKDFISNETSQNVDEINKNCLVHISFDSIMKPIDFIFYNDNGDIVYWGNMWKPKG